MTFISQWNFSSQDSNDDALSLSALHFQYGFSIPSPVPTDFQHDLKVWLSCSLITVRASFLSPIHSQSSIYLPQEHPYPFPLPSIRPVNLSTSPLSQDRRFNVPSPSETHDEHASSSSPESSSPKQHSSPYQSESPLP